MATDRDKWYVDPDLSWQEAVDFVTARAEAAEQRVREAEEAFGQEFEIRIRAGERIGELEAKLATAVAALKQIDDGVPSEAHWHRMGDSMWANIGRLAAKVARQALSKIEETNE